MPRRHFQRALVLLPVTFLTMHCGGDDPEPAWVDCPDHEECSGQICRCDANGQLREAINEQDDDRDGTVDDRLRFVYDEEGKTILRQDDQNGDGVWDEVTTFHYDENDDLVRAEGDLNGDGVVDTVCTWTPPCAEPWHCSPTSCTEM